ncbi:hypothetical protein [Emergencia sp. 1XD21-10]|uniref:hypothetical protein n=1 Tax=Emergencia sp. 1XD21-10 TaxID=2304569 RepID=UPI00137AB0E2|nr:hypothetical protein [Emergencia sp. 1XD21-10]NCE98106.1 hypothetical protein [Emergencia sp. 1XD21-10]
MKIDFESPKVRKVLGCLIIILALFLIGMMVKMIFFTEAEPETDPPAQELEDAERKAMLQELEQNANGSAEIDPEKAKQIMGLKIEISDELAALYLDGNKDSLQNEMENFLVKYDFYADVTKAVCTKLITKDYANDISYIEFQLNDSARTILTLEYHGDNGKFKFNFR